MSPALQCENGLVYEACGPACSPACPGTPSVSDSLCSALSCVEGCFCPHGTVRHGKRNVFMCVCLMCSSDAFSSLQLYLLCGFSFLHTGCLSVVCRWRMYSSVSVSVWVGWIFISRRSDCHSTLSELVSLESLFVVLQFHCCTKLYCKKLFNCVICTLMFWINSWREIY